MRKKEIDKLSKEELKIKLADHKDALLNLRFQKAMQQLEHPQKIKLLKREIAQIKTVINEFNLGIRGK